MKLSKFNESGRSMVEMLGVLAIIGILSVGAIAGYSKAMMKYKLNKQTEQIGSILDYVGIHLDDLKRSKTTTTGNLKTLLTDLNVIPKEMIRATGEEGFIYDVFNTPVYIQNYYQEPTYFLEIQLYIDKNTNEPCINLFQLAKAKSDMLYTTKINYSQDSTISSANRIYGDAYCSDSNECLKDFTLTEAEEYCNICNDKDRCLFYFVLRL